MSRISELLNSVFGENTYTAVPSPIGTQDNSGLVPNPNDYKENPGEIVDCIDQDILSSAVANIIDSLDDDDITDDLADIIENRLETVYTGADLSVKDACMQLPVADCQELYAELVQYLDDNDIDYDDSDEETADIAGYNSFDLSNTTVPSDDTFGPSPDSPASAW